MVYHQIPIGPLIPDGRSKGDPVTQDILHEHLVRMIRDAQGSQQNIF